MTRKEIIDGLKFTVDMFLFNPSTGETFTEPRNDMDKTTIDACKGAIKLLEQTEEILKKKERPSAKWVKGDYEIICSNCKYQVWGSGLTVLHEFKHCPNCGARMKGVEE